MKQRKTRRQSKIIQWYRLKITTDNFLALAAPNVPNAATHHHPLAIWAPAMYFPATTVPVKQPKRLGKARQTTNTESHKGQSLVEILDRSDFEVPQDDTLKPHMPIEPHLHAFIDLTLPEEAESSAMGASRMRESRQLQDDYTSDFIDLTLASEDMQRS